MRHLRSLGLALCLCGTGCLRTQPSLTDPDPANKIPAIRAAGDRKDRSALPLLVKDLNNEDPAVRFYTIEALSRFTGSTMGYVYYAEPEQRAAAVAQWEQWLKTQ